MALFMIDGGTSSTLITLTLCFISWYLISAVVSWYRLRQIPGPFLASFSYLWLANIALHAKQYEANRELHEKYGPLVRVGPNELTTDDPELIRKLGSPKSVYNKGGWHDGNRFNPNLPTMFITKDIVSHDKLKAKLSPGYSGRETPRLEDNVDVQLKNLVDLIKGKYAAPLQGGDFRPMDLVKVTAYFTLDVISQVALGNEFGCLRTESDPYGFYHSIEEHLPQMALTTEVPWIRNIIYSSIALNLFGPRETDTVGLGKVMGVTNNIVRQYYAPGAENRKDMLGSFVRHGLTQEQCEAEALFMFIAGADTTAAVMRITMLYVMSSPLIYQRLKQEIAEAVREGRASSPIKQSEAKSLPYLQAVVYEGLRMRPVALGLMPKVVPAGGETIHGKFIPGGTDIGMNLSALLRSKAVFGADADLFRPERFLEMDEKARTKMQNNVELTFGYGRWLCAGKPLALMELNKVFFELFRAFDFQVINPQNPMESSSAVLFIDRNLYVKVIEASN